MKQIVKVLKNVKEEKINVAKFIYWFSAANTSLVEFFRTEIKEPILNRNEKDNSMFLW
jgi:hypothetical protein